MNERDEAAIKEAVKELDARYMRAIVKEAVKELVAEYVRVFGWWSIRTIGVALAGAGIMLVMWAAGYAKVAG
ncbi:hypothetical protein [Arenimonas alkanexedens]